MCSPQWVLLALLVVVLSSHPSAAFNIHKLVRHTQAIKFNVAKLVVAGALVVSPLTVQADDIEVSGYSAVPVQLTNRDPAAETSTTREIRVVDVNRNSKAGEEEQTYLGKLKKEQAKQEGRKKTKTERAKDLCETLGRGC